MDLTNLYEQDEGFRTDRFVEIVALVDDKGPYLMITERATSRVIGHIRPAPDTVRFVSFRLDLLTLDIALIGVT